MGLLINVDLHEHVFVYDWAIYCGQWICVDLKAQLILPPLILLGMHRLKSTVERGNGRSHGVLWAIQTLLGHWFVIFLLVLFLVHSLFIEERSKKFLFHLPREPLVAENIVFPLVRIKWRNHVLFFFVLDHLENWSFIKRRALVLIPCLI